jgi:uncharacterized protein involved in exopolysaccharide biosynthesis
VSNVAGDEIDLLELWRAFWEYKILIVGTVLVCALIAAYLALTAIPVFRAEATISEADNSGANPMGSLTNQLGGLASLVGVNLGNDGSTREALAILESRRLAEEFVKRGNLIPALFPDGEPPTMWKTVQYFREGVLKIQTDESTGLTTVSVDWRDPALAANWANGYVALANDVLRARAIEESTRNIAYLNSQIAKTNVVEVQKVMYSLIEAETKTQMLANGKAEYAFSVIDPAVPPEIRISPKRTLMVLVGMFIGGLLGCIVALVHRTVKNAKKNA